jgi:hypothetical protein
MSFKEFATRSTQSPGAHGSIQIWNQGKAHTAFTGRVKRQILISIIVLALGVIIIVVVEIPL